MMLASRLLSSLILFEGLVILGRSIWYDFQDFRYFLGHDRATEEDAPLLHNILHRQQERTSTTSKQHTRLRGGVDDVFYNHVQHDHKIPNTLIFTHHENLLDLDFSHNTTRATRAPEEGHEELRAMQTNIQSTIAMHPNATVRFLTDKDCEVSIRNALGSKTKLVDYFRSEPQGMFKSDICRGAALWETGGLYFDVDLGARMSLWTAVGRYTSFVTVKVPAHSKQRPGFFQAFMGATPQHPLLQRYLQLFVQYYEGKVDLTTKILPDPDKHMLGVRLLRIAYDQLKNEEMVTDGTLRSSIRSTPVSRPETREESVASSNTMGIVELWQETLFSSRSFPMIPKPTWGIDIKSCRYVVVANDGLWPPLVPFYSRVAGSRLCPASAAER